MKRKRTHQRLVDDAEHVGIVEKNVHWSLGMKTDVCDGSIPLEPKVMKPLLLDGPVPLCILLVWDAIFKYLRKNIIWKECWLISRKTRKYLYKC